MAEYYKCFYKGNYYLRKYEYLYTTYYNLKHGNHYIWVGWLRDENLIYEKISKKEAKTFVTPPCNDYSYSD